MFTYKKCLIVLCTGLLALNFDLQASQKEKNRDKYAEEDSESDEEDCQKTLFLKDLQSNARKKALHQFMKTLDSLKLEKNCVTLILEYAKTEQCALIWHIKTKQTEPVEIVAKVQADTSDKDNITLFLCDRETKNELLCLTNDKNFMSLVASKVITLSDFKSDSKKVDNKDTVVNDAAPIWPKNLTTDELNKMTDCTCIGSINLPNDLFLMCSYKYDREEFEVDTPRYPGLLIWDDNARKVITRYDYDEWGMHAIDIVNTRVIALSGSYIHIFNTLHFPNLIPELIIKYTIKDSENKYSDSYLEHLAVINKNLFLTTDHKGHQCLWKLIPDDLVLTWQEYQKQKLKRIATEVVGSGKKRRKKINSQATRPDKKMKTDKSAQT